MRSELQVKWFPHELSAAEVTAQITTCENRFEVIVKPGVEIDSWWVQAALGRWIQSRMDSHKSGGHNPANSFP